MHRASFFSFFNFVLWVLKKVYKKSFPLEGYVPVFQNHIQAYLFVCWYHMDRYNINIKNWSCILMIYCRNTSPHLHKKAQYWLSCFNSIRWLAFDFFGIYQIHSTLFRESSKYMMLQNFMLLRTDAITSFFMNKNE